MRQTQDRGFTSYAVMLSIVPPASKRPELDRRKMALVHRCGDHGRQYFTPPRLLDTIAHKAGSIVKLVSIQGMGDDGLGRRHGH